MTKSCSKCKEVKTLGSFGKQSGRIRAYCKACACLIEKVRRENRSKEDKEHVRQRHQAYYQKHKDIIKARSAARRAVASEHINKQRRDRYWSDPEAARKRSSLWMKNNRAKCNAVNARRRASDKKRVPVWLTKEHKEQIKAYYDLAKKVSDWSGIPHQVDHIVPLKGKIVSGLHVPWNLQVVSAEYNQNKYNKFGDEYGV